MVVVVGIVSSGYSEVGYPEVALVPGFTVPEVVEYELNDVGFSVSIVGE